MSTTMKGFALLDHEKAGWVNHPIPECNDYDVICRPIALSPCTSDVHCVECARAAIPNGVILGHECIGQVVKVGKCVKDFKKGDKVIVPAITPDWGAKESQLGFHQHSNGMTMGIKFSTVKDGVMAEYFHVNEADANLAHLPDGVDMASALMTVDMMTTGFHGAELAEIQFGDVVCVIGIGPVGLMSVAASKLRGASRIFAVGTRPKCIEIAKEYGATDIINYKNGPIAEQIMKLTDGQGVDKVIVAGGDCDTFIDAVTMVRPGGVIGNVNFISEGDIVKIPRYAWGLGMGHKKINGGLCPGGRVRIERMLSLIQYGRVDPSKLITHRFEGLDSIEDAFYLMKRKPGDLIKPMVTIKYND